jgi:hypothetical protein
LKGKTVADKKLSELRATAQTTWADDDIMYVVTAADASKAMTLSTLMTEIITGVEINGTVQGPAGVTERNGLLIQPSAAITTAIARGVNVVMDWSGTYGATGAQFSSTVSGAGDHDHYSGLQNWTYHTSTGTTSRVSSIHNMLECSAGTITTYHGLYIQGPVLSGSGAITNSWNVYASAANRSYLAGGMILSDIALGGLSSSVSPANGVLRIYHDYADVAGGLSQHGILVTSTDEAAVGKGGVITLGGESGAASTPYAFASIMGAKEVAGATYNGYFSVYTTDTGSNNSEKMRVGSAGNLCLGLTAAGTSATKTVAISTGTAPAASPADACQLYSADQAAGNACLHTRTEGGAVIKLYQGAAVANPGAGEAEAKLIELLTILRAQGLIAT